jgi:Domain of unknown function (DUF4253)
MATANLVAALSASPDLAGCRFEPVEVAGVEAVVCRLVPPAQSVAMWRAAAAACPEGWWPVLTEDRHVHADVEPLDPLAPVAFNAALAARERVVRSSPEASALLDAIACARPQAEPYDERDTFALDGDDPAISLVVVAGSKVESVRPFSPDGQGTAPTNAELLAFLASWDRRFGVSPLYADGYRLELDVRRPPGDTLELVAAAREHFLLSHGRAEGFGLEDPARLLRRLMSDRWIVWWYGTL